MQALAEAYDRYHISDRAGAAIVPVILVDFDMITPDKTQSAIDKNKLRSERAKLRKETKKNEKLFLEIVQGLSKKIRPLGISTQYNKYQILFNILQNIPLASAHTFPSASATFGNTS